MRIGLNKYCINFSESDFYISKQYISVIKRDGYELLFNKYNVPAKKICFDPGIALELKLLKKENIIKIMIKKII
jgi:hypothetical protein